MCWCDEIPYKSNLRAVGLIVLQGHSPSLREDMAAGREGMVSGAGGRRVTLHHSPEEENEKETEAGL